MIIIKVNKSITNLPQKFYPIQGDQQISEIPAIPTSTSNQIKNFKLKTYKQSKQRDDSKSPEHENGEDNEINGRASERAQDDDVPREERQGKKTPYHQSKHGKEA